MSTFKYFTKIDIDIVKHMEGQWRATVRVQRRGPGAKTTEVEARVALVCAFTDDDRLLQVAGHAYKRHAYKRHS